MHRSTRMHSQKVSGLFQRIIITCNFYAEGLDTLSIYILYTYMSYDVNLFSNNTYNTDE